MGCSFIASVQKAAGKVLRPVAQVAAVIPGPWQVPALAAMAVDNAVNGNILGAVAAGVGAFGAGGGFSTAGFDTSKLTNPGGLFTSAGSAGGFGASTGVPGLSTGTAVSGIGTSSGLPTALSSSGLSAAGAPLYSASQLATTFPGAFSGEQLASLGGGLFSQQELASKFPGAYNATASSGGVMDTVGNLLTKYGTNILSSAASLGGSYLQGQQARDAAATSAQAQIEAARIAADAAKFKPVGVTTRFGKSNFGYDQNGNLINAGYNLSPELMAQQNTLMGMTPGMLNQFAGAQAATAPMGAAGQQAMALGQGYLATTPQQQAAKFMADQQALLAPERDRSFANLQNTMMQQGRMGLATGGTSTMGATNPELEAYYNAQRMQDLQLAAQATQGGQQYAQFGTQLAGAGGDLLKGMYGTQTAAFTPYQTTLGGAEALEGLGQNAMDIGTSIGQKVTTATGRSGMLLGEGMMGAARTMQPANAYSPWGAALSGIGNQIQQYNQPQQQQYAFDPYTGQPLNSWR
jgi:hypothetical protein